MTRRGLDARTLGALAGAHVCTDICSGALPALLPFLVERRGLSVAAASALIAIGTIGSSLIQPAFGMWADRLSEPALMPAGVATAACGIGLVGLCHSYTLVAVSVGVMGFGVAAFHPEAARLASVLSRDRRGAGMSYFIVGGNVGYALGPLIATPIVLAFGLQATPLIAVPGLIAGAALAVRLRSMRRAGTRGRSGQSPSTVLTSGRSEQAWMPFWRLIGVVVMRTVPFFALSALVPIYLLRHFHTSAWLAGFALTLMLIGGAIGTLVGGHCADRYGRRNVMVWAMVPLVALLALIPVVGLAGFIVVIVAVGFALEGPFSTTVVLGQEYLPDRVGLAAGVTYGAAMGMGGLLASGLGVLASATSIAFALGLLPVFIVLAVALTVGLPDPVVAVAAARRTGQAVGQAFEHPS